jgi:hypothetical protein
MPEQTTESKRHTRDSIGKTAQTLRKPGGLYAGQSQEATERRVRKAIQHTTYSKEG